MFKKLLLIAALLFGSSAFASTITLQPVACSVSRICTSVPNDAGVNVEIAAYFVYPSVHVYVDGIEYTAARGNGNPISGLVLYASDGSYVVLSTSWSTYRTCTHSGRGQYCLTHWTLTGGTIDQP